MKHFRLFYTDENGKEFSKRVVNTVGKGEIDRYEAFLLPLHPPMFSKDL